MKSCNKVCQLCNKTDFEVFKIKDVTRKYFGLVSEDEITRAKQLCNEQELCAHEKLTFQTLLLENMNKASRAKYEASAN